MKRSIKLTFISVLIILAGLGIIFVTKNKKPPEQSLTNNQKTMKLSSSAFENNQTIPVRYTCDDEDINPPLLIEWLPPRTKSLVLIVDDPDAPLGTWTHWLVFNIDPSIKEIKEDSLPPGAVLGTNDFGQLKYGGPCPPLGTHRYFFRLYALSCLLNLPQGKKRGALDEAMKSHILDQTELVGTYSRDSIPKDK